MNAHGILILLQVWLSIARTPMMTGTLLAQLAGKSLPATLTCVGTPDPTMLKFVISAIESLFQNISWLLTWKRYIRDLQCTLERRWLRMNKLQHTLSRNDSRRCRERKGKRKRKRNTGMMMMMMMRMMTIHITRPRTTMTKGKLTLSSGPPKGS